MKKSLLVCLLVAGVAVTGCAGNVSPNTYSRSDVGVASKAVPGVIVSRRPITIDNNSGSGGLAGATAGAIGGSLIGGNAAVNLIGAVGGAVVGGVLGNHIDKGINRHQGFEYIVKIKNGSMVSVVQSDDMPLHVKQHVLVLYSGKMAVHESPEGTWVFRKGMTRIVPDNT